MPIIGSLNVARFPSVGWIGLIDWIGHRIGLIGLGWIGLDCD